MSRQTDRNLDLLEALIRFYNFCPQTFASPPESLFPPQPDVDYVIDASSNIDYFQGWLLIHCGYGLMGEVLELLLEDNPAEELGDVAYYLSQTSYLMGITPEEIMKNLSPDKHRMLDVTVGCEKIANYIKKVFIYGQSWVYENNGKVTHYEPLVREQIFRVWNYLLGSLSHDRLLEVLRDTETKLRARYPDGHFSTSHSQERRDKCTKDEA